MAKRGIKPKHYVTPDGETIIGLRRDETSGRFFPVGKGSPSFGTDPAQAIHRFKRWQSQNGRAPEPPVPVTMPSTVHALDTLVNGRVKEWTWSPGQFDTDVATLKAAWRREVRDLILRNPRQAAIELDCEALTLLANVSGLKPPPPSKPLSVLIEAYMGNRTVSPREATNSRTWWTEFATITGARTVCDLSRESFQNYRETIKRQQGKRASVWVRSRFAKIKTVVRNALIEVELTDEEKMILGHVGLLKLPPKAAPQPTDVTREELKAILDVADKWETALILTALNAAYTPIDCQRLEWSMIRADGTVRFDRTKSTALAKQPLPRICCFWKRTTKALNAIRNGSPYVFTSTQGKPAHIETMARRFRECCQRAGIERRLTFKHLRKSALTAASNDPKVPDRQINLLAGHSAGIKDHYVVRKNVELACAAVEGHYFGK